MSWACNVYYDLISKMFIQFICFLFTGNGFNNYSRGRNSFRGSRGGPANNRNSTGGPGQLQNGFTSRGSSNQNNSRGGNRASEYHKKIL